MPVFRIDDVDTLASRMRQAAEDTPPQTYPFFLGNGCARAAGVPRRATMARRIFERFARSDPVKIRRLLPIWPNAGAEQLRDAFTAWMAEHTPVQRYKVFESFYRSVGVPQFYRDLADLVVAGYVTDILTTNVDTLLEQALDAAGLRRNFDYSVTVIGSSGLPSSPPRLLQVVKLFGDMEQNVLPAGSEPIEVVLDNGRKMFSKHMARDLVVVGHDLSDPPQPIDRWLASRSGGELWWVHPEADHARVATLAGDRDVVVIEGEDRATPGGFFDRLTLHLLRLPALEAADALEGRREEALLSGDNLRTILRSVARPAAEQLSEAANLLDRVVAEAVHAGPRVKTSLVSFLESQAKAVADEVAAPDPDVGVVAGALAAAHTLCRSSLGGVVSASTKTDLASAARKFSSAELP